MPDNQRSTYGTEVARPDKKVGVEVGGGEKSEARRDAEKRGDAPKPGSASNDKHERRPEGPHEPNTGGG